MTLVQKANKQKNNTKPLGSKIKFTFKSPDESQVKTIDKYNCTLR